MRFRLRTLLLVIALIALALVLPGEVRNRRERRHLARIAAVYVEAAQKAEKKRAACQARIGRELFPTDNSWELAAFRSWADEAASHERAARQFRESAAMFAREERAVRRRLLFPVIVDNRRAAQ